MPAQSNGNNRPAGFEDDDEDPERILDEDTFDPEEYDALQLLERLESVEEDMMELGVTTLEEVRKRIAELHREMDTQERTKRD